MTTRITTLIRTSTRNILGLALLGSLVAAASLFADDSSHEHGSPAKLVQIVRDATRQFIDVGAATDAGYGQFLGCVSGPDHGAMGVHYVNGPLVAMAKSTPRSPKRSSASSPTAARASWASSSSWTRRPGSRITEARRCSRARASSSWTARTAPAYRLRSSSCTFGLGGTTQAAPSWTGTTG